MSVPYFLQMYRLQLVDVQCEPQATVLLLWAHGLRGGLGVIRLACSVQVVAALTRAHYLLQEIRQWTNQEIHR